MTPKLLIVNNGLKDLCGHYFETSISIAEAARRLAYRPLLATHATCQVGIVPDWLECYPLFCTDHWMLQPPTPAPDLGGLRCDFAALSRITMAAVRRGEMTLHDYLLARFEEPELPQLPLQRTLRTAAKSVLRRCLPWSLRARLRGAYRLLKPLLPPAVAERDPLEISLCAIDAEREFHYTHAFRRDLERLLCLTGASRHDHVFLPTAHGRELLAVQQTVAAVGESNAPTFHLEFRHALDMTGCFDDPNFVHPYTTIHRILFDHSRRVRQSPRLRVYTDTQELREEYEHFAGLRFDVLPIPFRTNLIQTAKRQPDDALCIAFFGDVRDEKGFYYLPAVVEDLFAAYPGKVRFVVQASLKHPEWNQKSATALARLKDYPPEYVRLVGTDGPLSPDDYFRLVSEADLLLCPYSPAAYKRRSSGTLTEAIAAGIPTVVPAKTWLAGQQPAGSGETFFDEPSLVTAVRKIVGAYESYARHARRARDQWLAVHSPDALVQQLVGPPQASGVANACA